MSSPETPIGYWELGQWEYDPSCHDRITPVEGSPIVEWTLGGEDTEYQLCLVLVIYLGPLFCGVLLESDLSLESDDRTDLGSGESLDSFDEFFYYLPLLHLVEEPEHSVLSEPGECAP